MIEFLILAETVTIILLFISGAVAAALALVIATLLVLDWLLKQIIDGLSWLIDRWEQRNATN